MNIHLTDYDVSRCAANLDNTRLASAVKENAQMLCTVAALDYTVPAYFIPWKPTHANHPCTRWLAKSTGNVDWLMRYTKALVAEQAKAGYKPMIEVLENVMEPIANVLIQKHARPAGRLTPHANCARRADLGIDQTGEPDTVKAYRRYMAERWERQLWSGQLVQWRNGHVPHWLLQDQGCIAAAPTFNKFRLVTSQQVKG